MDKPTVVPPHVLIFPFPAQGHVNAMLKLAELLALSGLQITFLVNNQNHNRLQRHANYESRFSHYPGFRFEIVSDSVFNLNSESDDELGKLLRALETTVKPFLVDYLASDRVTGVDHNSKPVTCLIADGIMSWTNDLAREITTVPVVYFRTVSACGVWANFWIPELAEAGDIPFKGDDMDAPLEKIPGMESFLRRRDLPTMHRDTDKNDNSFRMLLNESWKATRTQPTILNTFAELEGPILYQMRIRCPSVYAIGPLHVHLKVKLAEKKVNSLQSASSSNSLREEDKSCIKWLDSQPFKSMIYVSFGSVTTVRKEQLMEFWHGLVNSGKHFLWVIRHGLIAGKDSEDKIPAELEARGYIVSWAPQEEVLAHPAVGGFLTHSGWNSTLESIYEGVPMICWPYFADQLINSRFVEEVWKLGVELKGTCDRVVIEKAVRDVMELRKEEFVKSAEEISTLAKQSVREGGSSRCNLHKLIDDIKLMGVKTKPS